MEVSKVKSDPVQSRKLPWLVDILLYPASKTCLTTLGVFIGIMLLTKISEQALNSFKSPPLFLYVFATFFSVISSYIAIALFFYMFWYFCECIRDSASGGIRAPEKVATFDDKGQLFYLVITLTVFWFPPVIYTLTKYHPLDIIMAGFTATEDETVLSMLLDTIKNDVVFALLWFYAIYFFPMGLSRVILFDSLSGLNPLLIIFSILRTFFKYFLVVVVFYLPITVPIGMSVLRTYLPGSAFRFGLLELFLYIAWLWLLLIVGHLTGRFYYRNEEKLSW
jgi:hypothetical protein